MTFRPSGRADLPGEVPEEIFIVVDHPSTEKATHRIYSKLSTCRGIVTGTKRSGIEWGRPVNQKILRAKITEWEEVE